MSSLTASRLLLVTVPLINFGPVPGGKLTFAHLLALGLFLVWGLRGRLSIGHPSFGFASAFLAMVVLNILLVSIRTNSTEQITQLANYVLMMIVMVVGYSLAVDEDRTPSEILEGYFQVGVVYAGASLLIFIYGFVDPVFLYAATDFFNSARTFDRGGISGSFGEGLLPRISGLSPEPSFWSIYMCTVLAVGSVCRRRVTSAGMLLVGLVLVLTLARTGLVVLLAMLLFLAVKRFPIASWLALTMGAIWATFLFDVKISGADDSIQQRLGSVVDGWRVFQESPLFGLGWGAFRDHALANRLEYPVIFNYYLQVAAEAGLVGLLLLLLFIQSLLLNTSPHDRVILVAVFVAWLSAPSYNLPYAWFLFGVLLAARRRDTSNLDALSIQQASR
jgi:hypothetical protein